MRNLFLRNAVLFTVVILTFTGLAFGQTHFEPVANQGQTAFPIFVTDATIDLVPLLPGDEIGVFDSDLCVGASVVTVLIDEENPLGIVTLQADPGNGFPGFTAGHLILFKVWSDLGGFEVSATPTFNPEAPNHDGFFPAFPILAECTLAANSPGPPVLDVGRNAIDFGQIPPNSTTSQTLRIFNNGAQNLILGDVLFSDEGFIANQMQNGDPVYGFTIAPGDMQRMVVTFAPTEEMVYSVDMTIYSNGGEEVVALSGEGYVSRHFTPVDPIIGQSHAFQIDAATVTNHPTDDPYILSTGDEIAVFDVGNGTCIGAYQLLGELVGPVTITASGFTINHDYSFYIYLMDYTRELQATYTYISGPTVLRNQEGTTRVTITADFLRVRTFNNSVTIDAELQSIAGRWYRDGGNIAGLDGSAEDGYDLTLDAPEPIPPEDTYLSVYFPHGPDDADDWNSVFGDMFMLDIRNGADDLTNAVKVYEYYTDTDFNGRQVSLAFTINVDYDEDLGVVMYHVSTDSFQNIRYEDVYTFTSNALEDTHELFNLRLGDATPPVTEIILPEEDQIVYEGAGNTVQWTFDDVTEMYMANIFYSTDAGETWTEFDDQFYRPALGLNEYDWVVPSIYAMYCKLLIASEDWAGNRDSTETDYFFKMAPTSRSYLFEGDRWYLFSIPLVLDPGNTPTDYVFGDGTHFVYDYTAAAGYGIIHEINQGPGYWVANAETHYADIDGTAEIDSTVLDLNQDWNIISGGLPTTVHKNNDLFFTDGQTIRSFEDAWSTPPQWILPHLYGYFDNSYALRDSLEEWLGYWMYVLQPNIQMITYAPYPGPPAADVLVNEPNENNWYVPIVVTTNGAVDRLAGFGVNEDASDIYDVAYDVPTPPSAANPNRVRITFNHGEWRVPTGALFSQDIRAAMGEETTLIWNARVEATHRGAVTVSFEGIDEIIPEGCVALVNHGGVQVDLRETPSFTFNYTGRYEFQITISNEENYVNHRFTGIPDQFAIVAAYPNPFNPTVQVVVAVPEVTQLTASVYDLLGREVSVIDLGTVQAGYQKLSWSAEGSAGIYFLRVSSDTGWQAVQKLMYLK